MIAGNQEQADKVLDGQDRLPLIKQTVYPDRRGLRHCDHSAMNAMADVMICFATGDLSVGLPGTRNCGRTEMRIKGWMHRADQTTQINGMFEHP